MPGGRRLCFMADLTKTKRELAEEIVDDILVSLSGRVGVGEMLERMKAHIYDEMEEALTVIVEKRLQPFAIYQS